MNQFTIKHDNKQGALGNILKTQDKSPFSNNDDSFEKQIENINEQIKTVSESDLYDDKAKKDKIDELKEQITQIEKQKKEEELLKLQEEQKKSLEKIKEKAKENTKNNVNTNIDGDTLSISKFLVESDITKEKIGQAKENEAKFSQMASLKKLHLSRMKDYDDSMDAKLNNKNLPDEIKKDIELGLYSGPEKVDFSKKEEEIDKLNEISANFNKSAIDSNKKLDEIVDERVADSINEQKQKEEEVEETKVVAETETQKDIPIKNKEEKVEAEPVFTEDSLVYPKMASYIFEYKNDNKE